MGSGEADVWIVRVADEVRSGRRETSIGMEGLWYFRRGRICRQNCLFNIISIDFTAWGVVCRINIEEEGIRTLDQDVLVVHLLRVLNVFFGLLMAVFLLPGLVLFVGAMVVE
jgi:hypothetical protein